MTPEPDDDAVDDDEPVVGHDLAHDLGQVVDFPSVDRFLDSQRRLLDDGFDPELPSEAELADVADVAEVTAWELD